MGSGYSVKCQVKIKVQNKLKVPLKVLIISMLSCKIGEQDFSKGGVEKNVYMRGMCDKDTFFVR